MKSLTATPAELQMLDEYLVDEYKAWCDTATGIIKVLANFRAARQAVAPSQSGSQGSSNPPSPSDDIPISKLNLGKGSSTRKHKRSPVSPPVTPLNPRPRPQYNFGPDYGISPSPNVATPIDDRKDGTYEEDDPKVKSYKIGDVDHPELSGKYKAKADFPYDYLFGDFVMVDINTAADHMEKIIGAGKAAFRSKYLACPALKSSQAKPPVSIVNLSGTSKTSPGSSTAGKGRKGGKIST